MRFISSVMVVSGVLLLGPPDHLRRAFRTIDRLEPGDQIQLLMPYGRFTYAVQRTRIVVPSATWVVDDVPGSERLVLTACHPLFSAARRIVVFARLTTTELA